MVMDLQTSLVSFYLSTKSYFLEILKQHREDFQVRTIDALFSSFYTVAYLL